MRDVLLDPLLCQEALPERDLVCFRLSKCGCPLGGGGQRSSSTCMGIRRLIHSTSSFSCRNGSIKPAILVTATTSITPDCPRSFVAGFIPFVLVDAYRNQGRIDRLTRLT
ncbi:unnamed protein product [Heligmosomoides polygyrus]|uniref:Uncharacterized protein n=1 Tax=Heligmosomoides polygyrus TaxID=6339 RepID=A0A183G2F9_HELPZ|nr:unnamed protein product [Heligmosomoides polygyrus]